MIDSHLLVAFTLKSLWIFLVSWLVGWLDILVWSFLREKYFTLKDLLLTFHFC